MLILRASKIVVGTEGVTVGVAIGVTGVTGVVGVVGVTGVVGVVGVVVGVALGSKAKGLIVEGLRFVSITGPVGVSLSSS